MKAMKIILLLLLLSTLTVVKGSIPYDKKIIQGYGLSPVGFPANYNEIVNFWIDIGSLNKDIYNATNATNVAGSMSNSLWRDSVETSGEIPAIAHLNAFYSNAYSYVPISGLSFFDGTANHLNTPNNPENSWLNLEAKDLFLAMLHDFVTSPDYQIPFLFLGNEMDGYFEHDHEDYQRWVAVYSEAYDMIKSVSPNTKVGTNFQYERMAGIGVLNGWVTEDFTPLTLILESGKLDFVALTVYPFFTYRTPNEINFDYLRNITAVISNFKLSSSISIIITEAGWPAIDTFSDDVDAPWEIGLEEQIEASSRIFAISRMASLPVELINWLFYNAMTNVTNPPSMNENLFGTVSLRDKTGNKFPSHDVWINEQIGKCPIPQPISPETNACLIYSDSACCTAEEAEVYDPSFPHSNVTNICYNVSSQNCKDSQMLFDCRYCTPNYDTYFFGPPSSRTETICELFFSGMYETCFNDYICVNESQNCPSLSDCVLTKEAFPTFDIYLSFLAESHPNYNISKASSDCYQ